MRVGWSDIAVSDLENVCDYIARDVPYYADLLVDRMDEAIRKLGHYPRIGRAVPEAGQRSDIREIIVQRQRVSL